MLKNIISIIFIVLGLLLIICYIDGVNNTDNMGGPMAIFTRGAVSIVAVPLGMIFLYIGDKLSLFSLHWIYRILFIFSSIFIFKNMWLYTNVPFELKLHSHKTIYPTWELDAIALVILVIFLVKSFRKKGVKQ